MLARWRSGGGGERLPPCCCSGQALAQGSDQEVWTARAELCADVRQVLSALTDPAAISRWAPVSFEVDGLAGGRLRAGSCERVSGSIAGIRATFEVEVHSADTDGLKLVARGPVALDVAYSFREHEDGVTVEAAVGVRRQRGIAAQVLRAAVAALLNGGALTSALGRLDDALSPRLEPELVAA
jgi:hypothetical protein